MNLSGNFIRPENEKTVEKYLLFAFKVLKYNHAGKKIVVENARGDYFTGRSISGKFCGKRTFRGYDVKIMVPKNPALFDLSLFLAVVEHEVLHLRNPVMRHDEMQDLHDCAAGWQELIETGMTA